MFQIFKRSKGRQNATGDQIRCEKWIRRRILHRHSAPRFSLHPTYRFSTPRVWPVSYKFRETGRPTSLIGKKKRYPR